MDIVKNRERWREIEREKKEEVIKKRGKEDRKHTYKKDVVYCFLILGAGQFDVCGPLHTCFFSGLNYMCCPTNEPPADAHPICPNGLHTVIDHEYRSVLCAPGRLACPAVSFSLSLFSLVLSLSLSVFLF